MKSLNVNLERVTLILLLIFGSQISFAQGVNSITILPNNATTDDTILVISNLAYFGNCSAGLVNAPINQFGSIVNIYPEYCGYGDTTLCHAIDTFSLGVLPAGTYTLDIEYHQGTVCGGGFDAIIETFDSFFQVVLATKIPLLSSKEEIILFPNPTSDFIEIKTGKSIETIKLFDLAGREIKLPITDTFIDIESINPGLYFLFIQLASGKVIAREIVKN